MKKIGYPMPKRMNNPITKENQKQNKYKNKKVIIDGIKFDSKKEGDRYQELKLMEKAGIILNLRLQVKYELQPSYKLNGKTIRSIGYIADFVYEKLTPVEGFRHCKKETIVEDTKGYRTQIYKLKKKLFEYKYKIEIKET